MRTPARIGLGLAALVAVAAASVALTLAVSRSDGPRTYTQDEVDRQLAAAVAAAQATPSPSPTPSPTPSADPGEVEGSAVIAAGTFVGRCVSGQAILSRWTLNAGYRLADLTALSPVDGMVRWPGPVAWRFWVADSKEVGKVGVVWPGGTSGLVLQDDKDVMSLVAFSCVDGKFTATEPIKAAVPLKPPRK